MIHRLKQPQRTEASCCRLEVQFNSYSLGGEPATGDMFEDSKVLKDEPGELSKNNCCSTQQKQKKLFQTQHRGSAVTCDCVGTCSPQSEGAVGEFRPAGAVPINSSVGLSRRGALHIVRVSHTALHGSGRIKIQLWKRAVRPRRTQPTAYQVQSVVTQSRRSD